MFHKYVWAPVVNKHLYFLLLICISISLGNCHLAISVIYKRNLITESFEILYRVG